MAEPTDHLQSEQPQLTKLRGFANRLDGSYPLPRERKKQTDRGGNLIEKLICKPNTCALKANSWPAQTDCLIIHPSHKVRLNKRRVCSSSRLLHSRGSSASRHSSPVPLPLPSLPSPSPPVNKHTDDDDVIAAAVIC